MEAIRTTMAAERLTSLIDLPRSFYGQDVEIIVLPQVKKQEQFTGGEEKIAYGRGCMKGKMKLAEDFDAPLEEFREYME